MLSNDVGEGHILIENNTATARSLTTGTNSFAAEYAVFPEFTSRAQVPVTIRNNHYISSSIIVRLGDDGNGRPSKYLTLFHQFKTGN